MKDTKPNKKQRYFFCNQRHNVPPLGRTPPTSIRHHISHASWHLMHPHAPPSSSYLSFRLHLS
jgi:hypothetical protein